ncbi:hypothetical protein D917_00165 [Trichinella nativa]|uniref:PAN domain protein n=1 Tax=Trichinella nativa TaxID=6335 RepID=A0A1Y3EMJ8_9BILA|nr:hypothetical protein D917_00165 [Trichinella nativa]
MTTFCKTFLMMFSLVLVRNVADALLFSGYIEEENLSCLFGSARYRGDIEHCTNEAHARVSYARCIRLCVNAFIDKKCSAVFYFAETQSCLVMNVSHKKILDEIQIHTLEIPSNKSRPYFLRISNVISIQSQRT